LSPEMLNNQEYGYGTDMRALGVILYELCEHKYPFEATALPALPALAIKIIRLKKGQKLKENAKLFFVEKFLRNIIKEIINTILVIQLYKFNLSCKYKPISSRYSPGIKNLI
jgi:serine/threonine protein kinase